MKRSLLSLCLAATLLPSFALAEEPAQQEVQQRIPAPSLEEELGAPVMKKMAKSAREKNQYATPEAAISYISPTTKQDRAERENTERRSMMSRMVRIDWKRRDAIEDLVARGPSVVPMVNAALTREVFKEVDRSPLTRTRQAAFWSLVSVLQRLNTPECRAVLRKIAALKEGEPGSDLADGARNALGQMKEAPPLDPAPKKDEPKAGA